MKKIHCFLFLASLVAVLLQGCTKDEPTPQSPVVQTAVVTDITEVSATVGAKIDFNGSLNESGICWNTVPNPTIEHNKIVSTQNDGSFSLTMGGLISGTTYFVRAYAILAGIATYGDQRSFITDGQLAITLPFLEGFRNQQFPPTYWQVMDHDGDGHIWYPYFSDFFGAASNSYSGDALDPYNFLISPKITISGTHPKLAWNIGALSANYPEDHYKVVVSTTKFTAENCVSIGDVVYEETLTRAEGWTLKNRSVDMSAYSGKDVYIAWVHYDCSDEYGIIVTDVRISSDEQPVPVSRPVMGILSVGDVLPGSVHLTGVVTHDGGLNVVSRGFLFGTYPDMGGMATSVEIETTASTVLTPFTVELPLAPGTTYFVMSFAENAEGITYSDAQIVETPATVKTVLFFEDFADNPFDASGSQWVLIDKDGDGYGWEYFADDEDQCARSRSYYSGAALTPENYMVLPPITIPQDAQSVELSFKVAASDNSDYEESYEVLLALAPVTIDNCRNAQVIKPLEILGETNRGWRFTGRRVDLSECAGQTVYIIFVHKECTDQASFLVTDIEVASFE